MGLLVGGTKRGANQAIVSRKREKTTIFNCKKPEVKSISGLFTRTKAVRLDKGFSVMKNTKMLLRTGCFGMIFR